MTDSIQHFLFEQYPVRGEMVQLHQSWQEVLTRRNYPPAIRTLLGEAMAAAVLLHSTIKIATTLTLQIQTEEPSPLSLLVVQVSPQGTLRGLARWRVPDGIIPANASFAELCGQGTLLLHFVPEQGHEYQSLVSLDAENLAEALMYYFDQSEQLPTYFYFAATPEHCTGFMLQRIPAQDIEEDHWQRLCYLSQTLTPKEMTTLTVEQVLHRLFHEETLTLFPAESVDFACTCSEERSKNMLSALPVSDLEDALKTEGGIAVTCEFCGKSYFFDRSQLQQMIQAKYESE